ncbi:hypothetical protein [Symbiobacterium terraclitae]|uniref:hypothetical protein n=1 Tax=Symbiobacterium terraclitae TaxID=557451 RepID=UPI0035B55221
MRERQPLTQQDVANIAQAISLLDPQHVRGVDVSRFDQPTVHLSPEALAELVKLTGHTGRDLKKTPMRKPYQYWHLALTHGGMQWIGFACPEQLPLFGLPVEPLPAEEEPAQALQAS